MEGFPSNEKAFDVCPMAYRLCRKTDFVLFRDFPYYAAGVTGSHYSRRYVVRNHTSGAHYGIVANSHSAEDDAAAPNPHSVSYGYRFRNQGTGHPFCRIE